MANKPFMMNVEPFIAAGIDPKTGLPKKLADAEGKGLKPGIKTALRVLDEQDAVTRYQWYNLPCELTSQELERLLYYKGQLCLFYSEPLDNFYFMPYALDGTIDFYGRYNTIHPVPMTSGTTNDEKKAAAQQLQYLSTLKLDVVYDVPIEPKDPFTSTVLLHDYTKQMSQTVIARQLLQEPILDIMSDCFPFMRTALYNSTGVQGLRVNSQDEESNVKAANKSIDRAVLEGQRYIPILAGLEFQDLAGGETQKSEEFLLAMQALDNFRLSLYGLENGGLFQKKSHMLESEQQMNAGHAKAPLNDGLLIRQHFCDIANSLWGLGIWCEISESAIGTDMDGDGMAMDEEDQSGTAPGNQPEGGYDEEL